MKSHLHVSYFRCLAAVGAFVAVATAIVFGATPVRDASGGEGAAEDDVVLLPPLIVTNSRDAIRWRYAALPDFEVLSACSDFRTRSNLAEMYREHLRLRAFIPPEFQLEWSAPRTIIFYGAEMEAPLSPDLIRAFAAQRAGGSSGPARRVAALLQAMPNLWMSDTDVSTTYVCLPKSNSPPSFTVTPEFLRRILERRTPPLPSWAINALVKLHTTASASDIALTIPPLRWISPEEHDNLLAGRRRRTLLPIEDLFSPDPAPGKELFRDYPAMLASQRELFVRWCHFGKGAPRRAAFWKLVERASVEPVTEEIFQEYFGLSYADVFERLSDFLTPAATRPLTIRFANPVRAPAIDFRDADHGELARLKGDWERLESHFVSERHPSLKSEYAVHARRTLMEGHTQGDRDPRLLAAIGLWELEYGEPEKAREFLQAAVDERVVRPRAYVELARLRWVAELARAEAAGPSFHPEEIAAILQLLETARTQSPALPETYELLLALWGAEAFSPARERLGSLAEGARYFPGRTAIVLQAALHHARLGDAATAEALLVAALLHTTDAKARASLEAFRRNLAGVSAR